MKRVAIVGFAASYKDAPFADPDVEIWGINELWRYLPRWTRWFEMHPRAVFSKEGDRDQAAHVAWLQGQPADKPIYMLERFDDIPGSVPYPLEALTAACFPGQARGYFTSSIAYMLAMAIGEGFEWIGLFGVDLASDTEYASQRPAAEYLIGLARGLGREVVVAPGSALLRSLELYGYDQQPSAARRPLSSTWLRARVAELTEKRAQVLDRLHMFDGALEEAVQTLRHVEVAERGVQLEGVTA